MGILSGSNYPNYRGRQRAGVNRDILKQGATVEMNNESRPVGTDDITHTNKAKEGVSASDNAQFSAGKESRRSSTYSTNDFPKSQPGGGTRSRSRTGQLPRE